MRKRGGKTRDSINQKPPKLDEEIKSKKDYLYIVEVKNFQNLARKMLID